MKRKYTVEQLINKGLLLTVTDLFNRGWTKQKIKLLPHPFYHEEKALWKLEDVKTVESDFSFYVEES